MKIKLFTFEILILISKFKVTTVKYQTVQIIVFLNLQSMKKNYVCRFVFTSCYGHLKIYKIYRSLRYFVRSTLVKGELQPNIHTQREWERSKCFLNKVVSFDVIASSEGNTNSPSSIFCLLHTQISTSGGYW